MAGQTGPVARSRQLVRAGVVAENYEAKQRPLPELKAKIRNMAEKSIVRLEQVAQKEFLTQDDIDMLAKILKLIREVDSDLPAAKDPAQMTDEELQKAAR